MSGAISTKEWASEFMREPWRKAPDDEIGGWCVILESEKRTPATGAVTIAAFASEEVADHIVAAHKVYIQLLQGYEKAQLEQEVIGDIDSNSEPPQSRAPES